jgi:hypothetical protein
MIGVAPNQPLQTAAAIRVKKPMAEKPQELLIQSHANRRCIPKFVR